VIGAESGIGKTTFVNQVARNVARTGVRVVKYSLEDRMEDIGKEELYYEINRGRYQEERYEWTKFVNNEY
jgi:KaiC/GvpD/RAD55 family RecA-like ATPase